MTPQEQILEFDEAAEQVIELGNRMLEGYLREAAYLIEEGALPQDVDRVMTEFGMAMGPFAVMDMSGLDVGWRVRQRRAPTRPASERYCALPDKVCEVGSREAWRELCDQLGRCSVRRRPVHREHTKHAPLPDLVEVTGEFGPARPNRQHLEGEVVHESE